VLTGWALVELWKTLYTERHHRRMQWLPLMMWITIPVVFWSYRNNMVDNTLAVFTTFAVVFMLRACVLQAGEFLVLGSLFTLAAFFTKGMAGIFPLLVPLLYGIFDHRHGVVKGSLQTLIVTGVTGALVAGVAFVVPAANQNIAQYFSTQVGPHLAGAGSAALATQVSLPIELIKQLTPVLLCLVAVAIMRLRSRRTPSDIRRNAWFGITLGLVASLPLMFLNETSPQSLLVALPFFAMSFATMLVPMIHESMEMRSVSWRNAGFAFNVIAVLAVVMMCTVFFNRPTRYAALLTDADNISTGVANCKIVSCDWTTAEDRQLTAYLQRMHRIHLVGGTEYEYLLMKKSDKLSPPRGYDVQLVPLHGYVLYKKSMN
jgi:4-amino-4-deoxy-L-arabinose transferase-like glycosyltransferase